MVVLLRMRIVGLDGDETSHSCISSLVIDIFFMVQGMCNTSVAIHSSIEYASSKARSVKVGNLAARHIVMGPVASFLPFKGGAR